MKPTPEEIKSARKNAGLTQPEAAKLIDVTCNAWQKWEAGDRPMRPAYWELFNIKVHILRNSNKHISLIQQQRE